MGYEVDMLVVDNWDTKAGKPMKGFKEIVATVSLCKVYEDFKDLLARSEKLTKKYKKDIERFQKMHDEIYNEEGNHTEEFLEMYPTEAKQDKAVKPYYKLSRKLAKALPYVYHENKNQEEFMDGYGDVLRQCTVDEVLNIINIAIAKSVVKGETPYRRYVMAQGLLEGIKKSYPTAGILLYGS